MSRRGLIWAVIAIGVAAVIGVFGWMGDGGSIAGREVSLSTRSRLEGEARDLSARLPLMVNPQTRLDAVEFEGDEFRYHYTLVAKKTADGGSTDYAQMLKPQLTASVCTSEQMRAFLGPEVSAVYTYAAADGGSLASIRIHVDDCP